MKAAIIFNAFTNQEEHANLEVFTRLSIGGRVKRTYENISACLKDGSEASKFRADKTLGWANGVLVDLEYQGFCPMRGNLVTARIKWDNGETDSTISSYVENA